MRALVLLVTGTTAATAGTTTNASQTTMTCSEQGKPSGIPVRLEEFFGSLEEAAPGPGRVLHQPSTVSPNPSNLPKVY